MNIKYIKKEIATAFGKCDIGANYFAPLRVVYEKLKLEQSKVLDEELGVLLSEVELYLNSK